MGDFSNDFVLSSSHLHIDQSACHFKINTYFVGKFGLTCQLTNLKSNKQKLSIRGRKLFTSWGGGSNFRRGHEKNSIPNVGVKTSFMNP